MSEVSGGVGPWVRGVATFDAGEFVLPSGDAETYRPRLSDPEILADLVGVRDPRRALRFISKHGPLWSGVSEEGPIAERWSDWERSLEQLRRAFRLYEGLRQAQTGDDRAGGVVIDDLLDEPGVAAQPGAPPWAVEQSISVLLDELVNLHLEGSETRLVFTPETDKPERSPGRFRMGASATTLESHAWLQLAFIITNQRATRRCQQCGAVFPVNHQRQKFCTRQCAQRARYRRWADKQKEQQ